MAKNHNFQITAPVEISAAASDGESKPRRFRVSLYNGGPLQVKGYDYPIVIDLRGLEIPKQAITANLHHDPTKIVGHSETIVNDGTGVAVDGLVSGTGDAAQEFLKNNDNGYPWQASIEAGPKSTRFVKQGESVNVNGKTIAGPVYVASRSKIHGFAFLSRGADESTNVTVSASAGGKPHQGDMAMELSQWIEAQGFDADTLNDKQKAFLESQFSAVNKNIEAGAEVSAPGFDLADISAAFSQHLAKMELTVENASDKLSNKAFAEIKAGAVNSAIEMKAKAIKEKWSPLRFEAEAIKAAANVEVAIIRADRPAGPAIHASRSEMNGSVIEAAMCQALRISGHEKEFDDKTLQAAHSQYKGRVGLQQVIIQAAAANGAPISIGTRIHAGNIREILKFAMSDIHAAMSTVSLPGILSNVANKEILMGYMNTDQVWREISDVKTVNDFKTVTSYRMNDALEYDQLGPNGEIKHGTVGEESYSRQAKTYAKMIGLSREQIINDDLGAFDDIRERLGRGAALKFNKVFWTEFLANGSTFWTTARTNYIEGATTNLGLDGVGLNLGAKAFMERKSPAVNSDENTRFMLGGEATKLLVPSGLKSYAETLYKATNLAAVKASDANIFAGKYRPVTATQIGDSTYSGYSTTAWYLFGDSMNPMAVSFLNGVQTPTIESADADFDTLGILFRGYHDFGCNKSEYMAGIKSKGAA
jgi:hypothetical protein